MSPRATARAVLVLAAAVLAAAASACWPLSVYAFTLALFGAPHALVELQWVARRYGASRTIAARVVPVLLGVALLRAAAAPIGLAPLTATTIELLLGVALVLGVLVPAIRSRDCENGWLRMLGGTAVLSLLLVGAATAPFDAMLVLAIAHNMTPLGFVADRLRDRDGSTEARRGFAAAGLLVFVALPLWLATGSAADMLGLASHASTANDLTAAHPLGLELQDGIAAFAPSFVPPGAEVDLLRAVAFLQVVHYVAVLLVLPRLGPRPEGDGIAPPTQLRRAFAAIVLVLTLLFAGAFAIDFREARAGYAVLAAVHVWLEFPALLLALRPRVMAPVPA